MGQIGIRIINVLLFTLSCFFTAGVFNHIAENKLAPIYLEGVQSAPTERIEPRTWEERKQILDRNLFGAQVAVIAKPKRKKKVVAPPPVAEIVDTKLPLTLLGTLAGNQEKISTAVIMNNKKKKHMVVGVGEVLKFNPEVTVLGIYPRRVLLQNREQVEELLLKKTTPAEKKIAAAGGRKKRKSRSRRNRGPRPRKPRIPKVPDPSEIAGLNPEEMDVVMTKIATNLMNDLEPSYDEDGKINGVRAVNISENGLLARAGVTQDDVIQKVNGVNIDSASSAARVLRDMSRCQPMVGTISGPAGESTIEITTKMLEEFECSN